MEDFEDLDSMYSAYDNWHRGMMAVSRSASSTYPSSGRRDSDNRTRTMERGEGDSGWGTLADEQMFLGGGSGRARAAGAAVPFYKTILSNLSNKNNQTYTVNEK